ncbi:MAG TPA: hypothetical protein VGO00_18265 [Kofleriaceae bacterium]|nr:hypothetical protein [Kofleriaceae bacterium]
MTKNIATLDLDQLSTVTGGANKANALVLDKLNSRYGSDGVVSFIGKPKATVLGTSGVEHLTGKFDVNALWGGDTKRSFSANVNVPHGTVSGLHTKILSSE